MSQKIVSQEEWNKALLEFSKRELEFNAAKKRHAEERRKLPWVKVEKEYVFDGENGRESLSDLFQGRSQLIMQHFMFTPEWKEGCSGCSVQAEGVDGARYHFEPKDISFVAVSRASIEKISSFKERMGWKFKWVSSGRSDFNFDFHVSFTKEQLAKGKVFYDFEMRDVDMEDMPGLSVFYKNEKGEIFRTYYGGDDSLLGVCNYLDLTPIGRNEKSYFDWIKHHDKY
ncbi:MAG: DUF899 domain-containing protein [Bdellovibrionaceae bacterium]|nr:DUF899 domain-containing protein [Pseudobdellovibrionaceae bacterium]